MKVVLRRKGIVISPCERVEVSIDSAAQTSAVVKFAMLFSCEPFQFFPSTSSSTNGQKGEESDPLSLEMPCAQICRAMRSISIDMSIVQQQASSSSSSSYSPTSAAATAKSSAGTVSRRALYSLSENNTVLKSTVPADVTRAARKQATDSNNRDRTPTPSLLVSLYVHTAFLPSAKTSNCYCLVVPLKDLRGCLLGSVRVAVANKDGALCGGGSANGAAAGGCAIISQSHATASNIQPIVDVPVVRRSFYCFECGASKLSHIVGTATSPQQQQQQQQQQAEESIFILYQSCGISSKVGDAKKSTLSLLDETRSSTMVSSGGATNSTGSVAASVIRYSLQNTWVLVVVFALTMRFVFSVINRKMGW